MLEPAWTILQQSKTCCLGVCFPWFSMFSLCLNLVPWSNVLPRELFDMLDYDGSGTIGTFGFRFPNLVGSNSSAGWAGADNPQKKMESPCKDYQSNLHLSPSLTPRNGVFSSIQVFCSFFFGTLDFPNSYGRFPDCWSSWMIVINSGDMIICFHYKSLQAHRFLYFLFARCCRYVVGNVLDMYLS